MFLGKFVYQLRFIEKENSSNLLKVIKFKKVVSYLVSTNKKQSHAVGFFHLSNTFIWKKIKYFQSLPGNLDDLRAFAGPHIATTLQFYTSNCPKGYIKSTFSDPVWSKLR